MVVYKLIFILSGIGRIIGGAGFIWLSAPPALRSGKDVPAWRGVTPSGRIGDAGWVAESAKAY